MNDRKENYILNNLVVPKNKFLLKVQQKSPEILTGVSIATGIGSMAFAIRGGMKLPPIIEDFKAEIIDCQERYSDNPGDMGREMTRIYARYLGKIAILFAPAVGLQAASIISMLSAKKIVDGRLAVATSAYAALSATFDEFVKKFKEKYGEEAYYDLRDGDKVEEYIDVDNDGNATTIRKPKNDLIDITNTILIEKGKHPFWMHDEDPGSILSMLQAIEKDCDRDLKADKILFQNDVRKKLRVKCTEYGQKYGWIYDTSDPNLENHVSFDLMRDSESWSNFLKGKDPWIWIRLNCDKHPIWQLLP